MLPSPLPPHFATAASHRAWQLVAAVPELDETTEPDDEQLPELPDDALDVQHNFVAREVHEETGLDVEITGILDVTFTHWVGVRENGVGEDYHGVHLVFSADLLPHSVGVTPRVTEADSSTQVAARSRLNCRARRAGRPRSTAVHTREH
mgnify:CR=1 FL=1